MPEPIYRARFCHEHYESMVERGADPGRFEHHYGDGMCDVAECLGMAFWIERTFDVVTARQPEKTHE